MFSVYLRDFSSLTLRQANPMPEQQPLMAARGEKATRSRAIALIVAAVAVLALCGVAAIAKAHAGARVSLEQTAVHHFHKPAQSVHAGKQQLAAVGKANKNAPVVEYVPVQMVPTARAAW